MNYENPSFPVSPSANVGPINVAPTAYAPKAYAPTAYAPKPYAAPMVHTAAYPAAPAVCYGAFTETGVILVLFILLVIISRAWGI